MHQIVHCNLKFLFLLFIFICLQSFLSHGNIQLKVDIISKYYFLSLHEISQGIEITCSVESLSSPEVRWYLNDSLFSPTILLHHNYSQLTFTNTKLTHTLKTIEVMRVLQTGQYHCTASDKFGTIASGYSHVGLQKIPQFVQPTLLSPLSSVFNIPRTWSVVLPCLIYDFTISEYQIRWSHNGTPIDTEREKKYMTSYGNLLLRKAKFKYSGVYQCSVENYNSNNNTFSGPNITISVRKKEISLNNNIQGYELPIIRYVKFKERIRLEYPVAFLPFHSVVWNPIPEKFQFGLAKLSKIVHSTDYIVSGIISHNNSITRNITLSVILQTESPIIISHNLDDQKYICEGRSVILNCDYFSQPPASIVWYHNGVNIDNMTNQISVTTEGYFQCIIYNELGTVQRSTSITYLSPPSIMIYPSSQIVLPYGTPVNVECRMLVDVQANLQWSLNGVVISRTSFLAYHSLTDSAVFTCTASNCGQTSEAKVSVIVLQFSPTVSIISNPLSLNITWPPYERALYYYLDIAYNSGEWSLEAIVATTYHIVNASNLSIGIEYTFRVRYHPQDEPGNIIYQYGSVSSSITIENKPIITHLMAISSSQIQIKWSWEGNVKILTSFVILYRPVKFTNDSYNSFNLTTLQLDASKSFEAIVNNLEANTQYEITIYGKLSDTWHTPRSQIDTIATQPELIVSRPQNVVVNYSRSKNAVILRWSVINSTQGSGEISGYKVFVYNYTKLYRPISIFNIQTEHTYFEFNHIFSISSYYLSVLAYNSAGDGPPTNSTFHLPNNIATPSKTTPLFSTSTIASNRSFLDEFHRFLPYFTTIPLTICLTTCVLIVLLIAKCVHMRRLQSVKKAANLGRYKYTVDTSSKQYKFGSSSSITYNPDEALTEREDSIYVREYMSSPVYNQMSYLEIPKMEMRPRFHIQIPNTTTNTSHLNSSTEVISSGISDNLSAIPSSEVMFDDDDDDDHNYDDDEIPTYIGSTDPHIQTDISQLVDQHFMGLKNSTNENSDTKEMSDMLLRPSINLDSLINQLDSGEFAV